MRPFPRNLTYANVVASLALFVSLGGAGYAASQLPKNSVGSAQLKANAVTGAKVKAGALDGTDLRNGSVGAAKINVAGLPAVPAATTASVANGIAKVAIRTVSGALIAGRAPLSLTASCDAGHVVVGGGADVDEIGAVAWLVDSHPQGATGWTAVGYNEANAYSSGPRTLTVYAICVPGAAG